MRCRDLSGDVDLMSDRLPEHIRQAAARLANELPRDEAQALLDALESMEGPTTIAELLTDLFLRLGYSAVDANRAVADALAAGPLDLRGKIGLRPMSDDNARIDRSGLPRYGPHPSPAFPRASYILGCTKFATGPPAPAPHLRNMASHGDPSVDGAPETRDRSAGVSPNFASHIASRRSASAIIASSGRGRSIGPFLLAVT